MLYFEQLSFLSTYKENARRNVFCAFFLGLFVRF
uniref:Uncharacterized protein n=1 Tax=Anguilla anguilla TaxID=7936 RepID=A0A0E9RZ07_ANGAN